MQTNPARRFASAVASLLGCLLLIALFMVQLRYTGYESGLVPVAHANGNAVVAHVPASPRTTVTAEYCSEVVAALDPNNPSGRTSTQLTFDDSWFFHDARTYQHDLATACSVLAAVCNSESQYYDGVAGSLPYAERTLGALGFHDVRTESYAMRSSVLDEVSSLLVGSSDVAAYTLASKTIASDGDGKPVTLLFVGIRGTYGAEWLSNFNFLGAGSDDADHRGFKAAEEEVEKAVRSYASDLGIDPAHTRILITGHSRGGAIANLLAADLGDPDDDASALAPSSGIYAYTFAAPCATRADDRHDPRFGNIFNVVNEADIVTQLPLSSWGFGRYGSTITLPSTVSVDFDDSYAIVQTAYQRNTGYALGCDEDDFATLSTFGSTASTRVPTLDALVSPLGIVGAVQSLLGLDLSAARHVHRLDAGRRGRSAGFGLIEGTERRERGQRSTFRRLRARTACGTVDDEVIRMQTDRRKELRDAYKSRRPDMGVVELRCTATGQHFLGITRDAAKELNSLRAKLNGGGHPNRPLQQLWSEHGENGFDFHVADTLEYENPEDVSADDLQALRDLLLAEDPEACKIWK